MTSGHVFHQNRQELHGVTVIVEGKSGRAYVGRYHERGPRGVVLHDVGIHDPSTAAEPRDAWIARLLKFGIRTDEKTVIVPDDEAGEVRRLVETGSV
ncbi:MAG TPA: hypothetical protein VK012_07250 [Gemmatimonadales bacterium]|nr:hypothetical protein [Gemmatimonadales bacterium]